MFDPNADNTLPNGAKVLNHHQRRNGRHVWLVFWNGHSFPYVTWLSNPSSPGSTYWGHYFDNVAQATEDFIRRWN